MPELKVIQQCREFSAHPSVSQVRVEREHVRHVPCVTTAFTFSLIVMATASNRDPTKTPFSCIFIEKGQMTVTDQFKLIELKIQRVISFIRTKTLTLLNSARLISWRQPDGQICFFIPHNKTLSADLAGSTLALNGGRLSPPFSFLDKYNNSVGLKKWQLYSYLQPEFCQKHNIRYKNNTINDIIPQYGGIELFYFVDRRTSKLYGRLNWSHLKGNVLFSEPHKKINILHLEQKWNQLRHSCGGGGKRTFTAFKARLSVTFIPTHKKIHTSFYLKLKYVWQGDCRVQCNVENMLMSA